MVFQDVWNFFANELNIAHPDSDNVGLVLQGWFTTALFSVNPLGRTIIPLLILWQIWCARNASKHRNIPSSSK